MLIFTSDKSTLSTDNNMLQSLKSRKFTVGCDITPIVNFIPDNDVEKSFKETVLTLFKYGRYYRTVFGAGFKIDSHQDCEKLGIGKTTRKYVLVFSLEDSLDYILHYICKCDVQAVRSIENYRLLSKTLLTSYFQSDNISFDLNILMGLDPKLDAYIMGIYNKNNNNLALTLLEFHKEILTTANVLLRIILGVFRFYGVGKKIVLSIGASSCVLTSETPYRDTITLTNSDEEIQDYILNVGCFERYEFLYNINFKWAQ